MQLRNVGDTMGIGDLYYSDDLVQWHCTKKCPQPIEIYNQNRQKLILKHEN
jgi:hypothetical protein